MASDYVLFYNSWNIAKDEPEFTRRLCLRSHWVVFGEQNMRDIDDLTMFSRRRIEPYVEDRKLWAGVIQCNEMAGIQRILRATAAQVKLLLDFLGVKVLLQYKLWTHAPGHTHSSTHSEIHVIKGFDHGFEINIYIKNIFSYKAFIETILHDAHAIHRTRSNNLQSR